MTAKLQTKNENKKDGRSKALENNPCSICRALGLPFCKGHGGGAGGGGDTAKEASSQNDTTPTPQYAPANIKAKSLTSYLENSAVWNSNEDFLYNFNHEAALFSLELDLAKGFIHFRGHESLSALEKKELNALYDKVENELKAFTQEINSQNFTILRTGNELKITIPEPGLLDQFITRLIHKNLIPDNNYHADLNSRTKQNGEQKLDEKEAAVYKSPNPFDISKGPRPIMNYNE